MKKKPKFRQKHQKDKKTKKVSAKKKIFVKNIKNSS